jgi:DNA polymerase-3 subunit gamma/tau
MSRTQHFRFTNIALKDIVHHLGYVLNCENIAFDDDSLEILARSGNGSLRDTLTLLDQAIIFSKGHIDIASVTDMLGIIDPKFIDKIFQIILQRDHKQILSLAEDLIDFETSAIVDEMINYLKIQLKNKNAQFNTILIDRFFRILSDAKSLLHINSAGEFVLLLTLNKLIEATYIKMIDDAIDVLEAKISVAQISQIADEKVVTKETPKKPETIKEEVKEEFQEKPKQEIQEVKDEPKVPQTTLGKAEFESLIKAIYDRDFEVGKCFENAIVFNSFEDNKLTWTSYADEDEQKILRNAYTHIKHFVQDIFGIDTVIDFQKGERKEKKNDITQPPIQEFEENSQSCGSCMENSLNITTKEVDARTILDSKMRNQIQESFGISKIRVVSKT